MSRTQYQISMQATLISLLGQASALEPLSCVPGTLSKCVIDCSWSSTIAMKEGHGQRTWTSNPTMNLYLCPWLCLAILSQGYPSQRRPLKKSLWFINLTSAGRLPHLWSQPRVAYSCQIVRPNGYHNLTRDSTASHYSWQDSPPEWLRLRSWHCNSTSSSVLPVSRSSLPWVLISSALSQCLLPEEQGFDSSRVFLSI